MDNLKIWNALKQPPPSALKTIRAGRLKGMSDINPQWRYQAMTEYFGPCGVGWKYEIRSTWVEQASEGQIMAFAEIRLYVAHENGNWSDPIPGIGGSTLVAKESKGLYSSDEAYKMAVTDALSVAMKMLGVASDIYMGLWDGSKYKDAPPNNQSTKKEGNNTNEMSKKQMDFILSIGQKAHEMTKEEIGDMVKWKAEQENLTPRHWKMSKLLLPEENFEKVLIEYSNHMRENPTETGVEGF